MDIETLIRAALEYAFDGDTDPLKRLITKRRGEVTALARWKDIGFGKNCRFYSLGYDTQNGSFFFQLMKLKDDYTWDTATVGFDIDTLDEAVSTITEIAS